MHSCFRDYVTEDEESEDEDDKLVKEENLCKSQKEEDVSTLEYIILSGGEFQSFFLLLIMLVLKLSVKRNRK